MIWKKNDDIHNSTIVSVSKDGNGVFSVTLVLTCSVSR